MAEITPEIQAMLDEKQLAIDVIGRAIELLAEHAKVPNQAYDPLRDAFAALHQAKARIEIELMKEKTYLVNVGVLKPP